MPAPEAGRHSLVVEQQGPWRARTRRLFGWPRVDLPRRTLCRLTFREDAHLFSGAPNRFRGLKQFYESIVLRYRP